MYSNRRLLNKIRKFVSRVLILFIYCTTLLKANLSPDLYFLYWGRKLDDTSCHYLNAEEELPSADGAEFSPPERSIFFHETSCRKYLDPRQACAVESAARAHPEWQINILFASPITNKALGEGNLALIRKFDNVKLFRIHIIKYAEGTPMESLVASGALNRTHFRISHTSDVLRYLTLFKWGGVYLDFDVIVAKPLGSLAKNWAAKEADDCVNSAALAFSRDQIGRTFADATIRNLKETFKGDHWNNNGPGVMTRVLKHLCSTDNVTAMSAATCGGFEIYAAKYFYPIAWQRSHDYFARRRLAPNERNAYVYHTWNHVSEQFKIVKGSPYAKLAKKYCPMTYYNNAAHFGSK